MRSNSHSKDFVLEEEVLLPGVRGRVSDKSVVGASSTCVPAFQRGEANGDRNKSFFKVSSVLFLLVNILPSLEKKLKESANTNVFPP